MSTIQILSALGHISVRCFLLISVLLSVAISASAQNDVDANTLLLLRFENTLNGEQGVTFVRDPFSPRTIPNLSSDQRTRISLSSPLKSKTHNTESSRCRLSLSAKCQTSTG